jgi:hypothetical protein
VERGRSSPRLPAHRTLTRNAGVRRLRATKTGDARSQDASSTRSGNTGRSGARRPHSRSACAGSGTTPTGSGSAGSVVVGEGRAGLGAVVVAGSEAVSAFGGAESSPEHPARVARRAQRGTTAARPYGASPARWTPSPGRSSWPSSCPVSFRGSARVRIFRPVPTPPPPRRSFRRPAGEQGRMPRRIPGSRP